VIDIFSGLPEVFDFDESDGGMRKIRNVESANKIDQPAEM
jgi:hypothetical protein